MAKQGILNPAKWFSIVSNMGSISSNKSVMRKSKSKTKTKTTSRTSSSSSSNSNSNSGNGNNGIMSPRNREEELREAFGKFDGDGDGKISAFELRWYLGSMGEEVTEEQAKGVIKDLDSDGDNLLDFKDFLRLMNREVKVSTDDNNVNNDDINDDDDEEDLKKAFEMFEWEKGSGCITPKGLHRMLHRLGHNNSYEECVAMIHAFDVDRNGVLDLSEFHQMMA